MIEELSRLAWNREDNPYRKFFQNAPTVYETPVNSWEEFCGRVKAVSPGLVMPREAPTYMNNRLEDSSFFPEPDDEVALVTNVTYCPPFLHRLAFIKVVYVVRGSCFLMLNGERIRLEEGNFCLVGTGVEQAVYTCRDGDVTVNLLTRFDSFADSFLGLMTEQGIMSEFLWRMLYNRTDNGVMLYRGRKEEAITDAVLELCTEILDQTVKKSNLIRKSLLQIFYGYVLRLHANDLEVVERTRRRRERYRLPEILGYLRGHLTCSLPELADHFELSEGYLSLYIKRETGKSFAALLMEYRMRQARTMLVSTDFSVDKIVEAVGYTDKSRFYRNFKSVYGVSPVRYRKGGRPCMH